MMICIGLYHSLRIMLLAICWRKAVQKRYNLRMPSQSQSSLAGFRMHGLCFAGDKSAPWAEFLRTPAVWAIIAAHFCYNYGYYTLLAWLPSYFELALGLPVDASSLLTLIPYVTMVAMTPFVGPVADGLVKKEWTITRVRKLAQVSSCSLLLGPFVPCAQKFGVSSEHLSMGS